MKLELALLDDEGKLLSAVNVQLLDGGLLTLPVEELTKRVVKPAMVVLLRGARAEIDKRLPVTHAVAKALNGRSH